MIKLRASCLTFIVLVMFVGGAFGQEPWEFKHSFEPGVLTANGDWTGSLGYDLSLSHKLWSQPETSSFRKSLSARFATEGTVAADADLNTKPLTADAKLTTALNLYKAPEVVLGDSPGEYKKVSEGYNYGRMDISAMAGYETDQRFDNRNFTIGAEVGYVLTENMNAKALIPSVFLGYDMVIVDNSEIQDDLGVDDDVSGRFRAFASWKIPIGHWLPEPLDPLNVHIDLRYYNSTGLPSAMEEDDQDEATYAAGALSYSFGNDPLWGIVNAAFVRVADGRIPPNTDDETTITFGLTVWER